MVRLLRLQLFGGFRARLEPGQSVRLPTRKAEALLAYLALPAGQPHPRDKLASLLWGELGDARARASLRQALFRLRRAIGVAGTKCLRLDPNGLALDPASVTVDVAAFERAIRSGDHEGLTQAAELYEGDLLAGLAVAEPPFDEWLLSERERLRELALEGLARLLVHQRANGHTEAAIRTALKLAALDPLQEAVHRTLMRLYAALGRRGAALRQYQHCVAVLRRELGVEPEPETKELYQQVLRGRPPRNTDQPPLSGRAEASVDELRHRPGIPAVETLLIGRERERARLQALLDDARRGRGGVVVIEGEAGIGKSRLLAELVMAAWQAALRVLTGRCHASEQILPFGPWADALRAGRIARDDAVLRELEPFQRADLAQLLPELGDPDCPPSSGDARRLFESITRLLEAMAATTPTVLVLDDAHWADDMSLRLLAFVARRTADRPILVAITLRTEELDELPALHRILDELDAEERLTRLPLAPLARPDTLALMHALLGRGRPEAELARLGEQVWTVSQGNPFVVTEALRAVADRGTSDPLPLGVPDRVRVVISRRLARLGPRARELAVVAAVIGREFTFALLRQAAAVSEPEAAEAVEELVRRQVLQHIGDRFDFVHDRVREVVYGELLAPRRILLHRAVADAIEALRADAAEARALALGFHYLRAEVWDKAVEYLGQAGSRAIERSAYCEAAECLEQAIAALTHLPPDPRWLRHAIDLRLDLARPTLYQLGHVKRAAAILHEAEELARAHGDDGRLGRVTAHLVFCLRSMGQKPQAIAAGQRALAIARRLGDIDIEIPTNICLGQVFHDQGDYRRAVTLFRRNVEMLVGDLARPSFRGCVPRSIHARTCLVSSLAELGEFDEAAERAGEAVRAAHELGRPHGLVVASAGLGHLLLRRGHCRRALEVLEPALTIVRADDTAQWFPRTASTLGSVYVLADRPGEAVSLLEEALERTVSREVVHQRALTLVWLGEATVATGHLDRARHLAEEALRLARDHDERGHEAWALRLLGEIRWRSDPRDFATAADHFGAGLALADRLCMRPLAARAHLGLGLLTCSAARHDHCRAHLTTALAMFRELGMPLWLAEVESALKGCPGSTSVSRPSTRRGTSPCGAGS